MKPVMPSRTLLDGKAYTPSHATDIRALFQRVRAQMRTSATVTTLPQRRNGSIK